MIVAKRLKKTKKRGQDKGRYISIRLKDSEELERFRAILKAQGVVRGQTNRWLVEKIGLGQAS